VNGSEVVW